MQPPRNCHASPLPSYAVTRPGGKDPSVAQMLTELMAACGWRRRSSAVRDAFRQARMIDRLAEMDLEPPPPESSVLSLARRQRRRKGP
jgi:hypothetical protein